jgi:hypothetical protein
MGHLVACLRLFTDYENLFIYHLSCVIRRIFVELYINNEHKNAI